jgi:Peptidase A4 family
MATGNVSPGTVAGRVRTFSLPPAGFDPRSASPAELRRYGIPQRPEASARPELAALWDKIFSRKLTYIAPRFQPLKELVPGIKSRGPLRQEATTVTHPFWSGGVVHSASGQAFTWVLGQWNVPDVQPPPTNTGQGEFYSFAWIGIDGNSDVTQMGTIQYVTSDGHGKVSRSCYAVYEWFPNDWTTISNFQVNFGDTLIGLICLESTTDAWANLVNVTTGVHVSFSFSAPGTTTSLENQIEWVMEHPGVTGESPQLPNFGEIYFDSAIGGGPNNFLANAGPDTVINMAENNVTVATTSVETPTLIKIAYTG